MYVSLALVSGGLVALMILVNGGLQSAVGPFPALIFIHGSGLATSVIYLLLWRRGAGEPPAGATGGTAGSAAAPSPPATAGETAPSAKRERPAAPLWFAAAGVLGIGVVLLNNLVFAKGGVLLALGGTLAGQTLFAHLLEGTHWFDRRRSPPLQRVLSLGLVLPGAAIIGLRSGVGVGWVALSWLPGAILMVQSMMNARNALRWGQRRMVLFNYSSALLVLVPLFALSGGSPAMLRQAVTALPLYRIVAGGMIGVVVVGTTAFLFNRASALKVVLALYTGQILIGILLDSLSGLPLQPEKVAGVVMVLVGLAAGELSRLRRGPAAPHRSSETGSRRSE